MTTIKDHVQVLSGEQTLLPGSEPDFPFPKHAESHEQGGSDPILNALDVTHLDFNDSASAAVAEGRLIWNDDDGTLNLGMKGSTVNLQIGQENLIRAKNTSGGDLTNGQMVFISGGTGSQATIGLGDASTTSTAFVIGMLTEDVASNAFGYVTTFGLVRDLNTASLAAGTPIYLDTTPGDFTGTQPAAPNWGVPVGQVIRQHATEGVVFITISIIPRMIDLSDADISAVIDDDVIYYDGGSSTWKNRQDRTQVANTNGFVDGDTDVTVVFDDGTRTLSLTPTGPSYSYWSDGLKYTVTGAPALAIADTEGMHYFFYDGASLSHSTTWSDDYVLSKALIAAVYWDATNNKQILHSREHYHGPNMAGSTHLRLHDIDGYSLESGGSLGNFSIGAGAIDADAEFSCEVSECHDEDAEFDLAARLSTANLPVYYRDGADASNIWRIDEDDSFAVLPTGTGRAAWNELNAGTWSLTEVTNAKFVLAHVALTNDTDRPFVAFVGQAEYANALAARDGAEVEVNSLITNGLPMPEFKFVATVIFQTNTSYANAVKSKIVQYASGVDYVDLRGAVIGRSGTSVTVTDHGALAGLPDDDHTQYLLVDGTRAMSGNLSMGTNNIIMGTDKVLADNATSLHNSVRIRTSSQTPDTGMLNTGTTANSWIVCEYGDRNYDFAHALQINPTVYIQSANQSATEWLSLAHDATHARLLTGAGAVCIGSGTPGKLTPSPGEFYVTGKSEFDTVAYFDAGLNAYGTFRVWDNIQITGPVSAEDGSISLSRTAQTPNCMVVGLGNISNSLIICEQADIDYDFAHPLRLDPTVWIQSANQSATEWGSLAHDATNFVINAGSGSVNFPSTVLFDSTATHGANVLLLDDQKVAFGDASDAIIEWSTDQTNHSLMVGLGSSNLLMVCEASDVDVDFGQGVRTNPALYIHSADATDLTEYLTINHNGTDAVFRSGKGTIDFKAGSVTGSTVTHDAYWEVKINGVSKKIMLGS